MSLAAIRCVLVSAGVRAGPLPRRGNHRPPGGGARASPGRRASSATRRAEGLRRHHGRRRVLSGGGAGRDVAPEYAPKTVSTDGWKSTQAAWKALCQRVIILQCRLHAWLKIRDRAEH